MHGRTSPALAVGLSIAFFSGVAAAAGNVGQHTSSHVNADFNNDSYPDNVFGYPLAGSGKGSFVVVYGDDTTNWLETWTRDTSGVLDTADYNDNFGDSLAAGDINGDGYDDLVVGVPGDVVSSLSAAGTFHVFYGSSGGITATGDQIFSQDTAGIEGASEAGDRLGEAAAVGDFDCDGYADVAVGAADEAIGMLTSAGAVNVLYGSSGGLSTVNDQYHQDSSGVTGVAEVGDNFGGALAAGNFDNSVSSGHACYDLAIGVPGEDIGVVTNAGYVYVMYGGTSGLTTTGQQEFYQDLANVEETGETSDQFGTVLWIHDTDSNGIDDLWVRVPGDDCSVSGDVGYHSFPGSTTTGLSASTDSIVCGPAGGSSYVDQDVQDANDAWELCITNNGSGCYDDLVNDLDIAGVPGGIVEAIGCVTAIFNVLLACGEGGDAEWCKKALKDHAECTWGC